MSQARASICYCMVRGHLERTATKDKGLLRAQGSNQLHCSAGCTPLHTHTHVPSSSILLCTWMTDPLGCIIWVLDGFGQWEPPGGREIRRNESQDVSSLFLPCFESWSWQWLDPSVILGSTSMGPSSHPSLVPLFPLLDLLGL